MKLTTLYFCTLSRLECCTLIAPLAQHYRVYVPDLLGFGLSSLIALTFTTPVKHIRHYVKTFSHE